VVWKQTGLGSLLYEIVPGFVANSLTIIIVNMVLTQKNKAILREYEQVKEYVGR
jgi:sodium/proline symporter